MNKKAISELITAILIILLVLGAIVIVWTVVKGTVEEGAGQIEGKAECIGLDLKVLEVTKEGNPEGGVYHVKVKRGADSIGSDKVIVTALCFNGESEKNTTATVKALETKTIRVECGDKGVVGDIENKVAISIGLKTDKGLCEGESGEFEVS